ncbi:NeuD/PglB/VioB family sugar acetyltransferase [Roseococcus sp. SDR]|uniref:NeuD/PglB/VioB family sugar acetyltransferase n=1 Tax=Roseococcus sp. SDR TaxID=2835532 RepID=UPI001BD037DE|nr:NeuD/PglB/VioB family sugar acetyltransferase [Roseococcus sp. SDR]MBS7793034.1 NeuD/PglB/VioB family sugar acetyltransferase [Roseococcus sp. SDR]MBV1848348.1 NeuD/PglB/VioB family sugar acetyltransferase [Roseococcus sp. SDR]
MRVLILGAGGHGRAVCEAARDAGFDPHGFLDARAPLPPMLGLPVLGDEAAHDGGPLLIALGGNRLRLEAAARLACPLPVLLHPSVIRARSAEVAEGAVVMPRVVLGALARIGRLALVNTGAIIEHDVVLEEGAHVAPGAVLCGGVRVGARAMIGPGVVVAPNIVIGADAVVGAGAAVLADVPPGAVVAGRSTP